MKKIINVKPVTELELQFEDGKVICVVFDTEAVFNLTELDGGINSFMSEKSLPERCAKIIYAGAKTKQNEFTIEDARALVCELSPVTITEIMNEFNENMGVAKNEVQSELQKKLMKQFLESQK
jgi:hypothetical protein